VWRKGVGRLKKIRRDQILKGYVAEKAAAEKMQRLMLQMVQRWRMIESLKGRK